MSRRQDVATMKADQAQHAGLWLDKYLVAEGGNQSGDDKPKSILVGEAARIPEPPIYEAFYKRWKRSLAEIGVPETHMRAAKVTGRLAVGLGSESVLETAITLHRTYGVPFIPGSALKGLAASYARRRLEGAGWRKDGEDHNILFGSTETAGYVTFFDALYVPGSGFRNSEKKPQALWADVITVHHPTYYQGDQPPADWDSPNPIPFLSATGNYLIALHGEERWVQAAFEILELALTEEGIGAKTSSGYGRMVFGALAPLGPLPPDGEPYVVARKRLLSIESPPPGRERGTVAEIRRNGDFGFINPAAGGGQIFVHSSQLTPAGSLLRTGQVVEYRIGEHKGKPQAQEVVILLEPV